MNKRETILSLIVSILATFFIEILISVFFNGWVIRIISALYFFVVIIWFIADIYYFRKGNSVLKRFIAKDVFYLLAGVIFLILCINVYDFYGQIWANILFTCIIAFLLTFDFLDT